MSSTGFAGRGSKLQLSISSTFTTIVEMRSVKLGGSKADMADITNMDSAGGWREYLPTLLAAGEISFSGIYVPGDTTQAALLTNFQGMTLGSWKIVLPAFGSYTTNGGTWAFSAYITALDIPDVEFDKEAVLTGKLQITGEATFTVGS